MSISLLYSNENPPQLLLDRLTINAVPEESVLSSSDKIIQWGKYANEYPKRHRLNVQDAVQLAKNKSLMKSLLTLHGISTLSRDSNHRGTHKKFMVPVFHCDALTVFRTNQNAHWLNDSGRKIYREWKNQTNTKLWKNVTNMAVRAVYALGLDLGQVLMCIDSKGRLCVVDVEPEPRLNERLAQLYASAIDKYAMDLKDELNRASSVVMGMDPEFVLRNQSGHLVSASKFLPKRGRVGCDAIWLRENRSIFPLAELRPKPATEPKELIKNLYRTMMLASRKITDHTLDWLAGAAPLKGYPLGGHIHFSNVWRNHFLVRALDNYLTLPLTLLEDTHSVKRRPKYGFLGDTRLQFHGGFEYRTTPSWIVSPVITRGVIALAKLISDHYWELDNYPLLSSKIQEAYYKGDKAGLLTTVKNQWVDLMRLPDYEKYKTYLEPFKKQVISMESWSEAADIRRPWKLPPYHHSLSAH
jgi:hypothetical protein